MLTDNDKRQLLERDLRELEARLFVRELDYKKVSRASSLAEEERTLQLAAIHRDIAALKDAIAVVQEELDSLGQAE